MDATTLLQLEEAAQGIARFIPNWEDCENSRERNRLLQETLDEAIEFVAGIHKEIKHRRR